MNYSQVRLMLSEGRKVGSLELLGSWFKIDLHITNVVCNRQERVLVRSSVYLMHLVSVEETKEVYSNRLTAIIVSLEREIKG